MTKVIFFKENGKYIGYEAIGHSGFGTKGNDLVCCAISVLTINTANALEEINHENLMIDSKDGNLKVILNSFKEDSSQVLIKALVLGVESIQKEYGSKYCKVVYKEENANVKA